MDGVDFHLSLSKDQVTRCQLLTIIFGRVAAWATSFMLIGVGGAQLFEPSSLDQLPLSEYIISGYLIFFGLVFLWTEFSYFFLFKYFGFLFTYIGRGLAYFFFGGLCFGLARERFFPLGILSGVAVCAVGITFIILFILFPDTPNPKPLFANERRK